MPGVYEHKCCSCQIMLVVLGALALMVISAGADEMQSGWHPPSPLPDDFDWVQLTSGEWLKGEIVSMYEEKLEFELTKRLDLDISLIWDRIKDPQADSEGIVPLQDDYRLVTSFCFDF